MSQVSRFKLQITTSWTIPKIIALDRQDLNIFINYWLLQVQNNKRVTHRPDVSCLDTSSKMRNPRDPITKQAREFYIIL